MQLSDLKQDNEMYFTQIIEFLNLMLENDNINLINLITLRDVAEKGLTNAKEINNIF